MNIFVLSAFFHVLHYDSKIFEKMKKNQYILVLKLIDNNQKTKNLKVLSLRSLLSHLSLGSQKHI